MTVHGFGGAGSSSLALRELRGTQTTRLDVRALGASALRARLLGLHTHGTLLLDQAHDPPALATVLESWDRLAGMRLVIAARAPIGIEGEACVPLGWPDTSIARAMIEEELARMDVVVPPDEVEALVAPSDGWPLAARAIARWARVLGPRVVLQRGLLRLEGELADACRVVLEEAWDALTRDERTLLAGLAFGSAWVEAGVLVDASDAAPDTTTMLATLVDRSWLATDAGRVRVPIPLASFVRERCGSARRAAARRAHVSRLLARGERARAMHRRDPIAALAELDVVRDELVALADDDDPRTAVRATLALEPLFLGRLAREAVLELLARARAMARAGRERSKVTLALARTLIMRGEHESAERALRETTELDREPVGAAYRALFLGHIAAWRGELELAAALLDEADTHAARARDDDAHEDLLLQRLFLAHRRGDLDATERLARLAAEHAAERPSPRLGAIARRFVAEVLLVRGAPDRAARLFEQSRDELESFGDRAGALGTSSRVVEALRAAGQTARAEAEASAARVAAARAGELTLELSVLGIVEGDAPSWARVADLAWRVQIPLVREHAERWLARHAPAAPPVTLRLEPAHRALLVDARRLSLARRATLWRILESLALAHGAGAVRSSDALFRAGWPGERAEAASKKKRVQTAVWALRKLGLDATLETRPEGYALASEARVTWG